MSHVVFRSLFFAALAAGWFFTFEAQAQQKKPNILDMALLLVGKLDHGLDDAKKYGWMIVDMKNDWRQVFPMRGNGR